MTLTIPNHRAARMAVASALFCLPLLTWTMPAAAQEQLPWARSGDPRYQQRPDDSGSDTGQNARPNDAYSPRNAARPPSNDAYSPPRVGGYAQGGQYGQRYGDPYPQQPAYGQQPYAGPSQGYGQPYSSPGPQAYGSPYSPPGAYGDPSDRGYGPPGSYDRGNGYDDGPPGTYSSNEILQAGHGFFGSVSKGLASVVEYAFKNQGRPNGYILGQDAGGAFVAGLRYGEGVLFTRDAGTHKVFWQGPSIGYDAGAEGSKVMVLVYNLRDPEDMYQRFGGVDGSAYFVGGVGITFQKNRDIVVAPIRSGVGLRLGANVGYLKYTRRPTWNPF